ncbi:hypothetical protein Zmor_002924 [Zophobas morio]|uniref:Uncharacterized protein n=1 Tax=Zophobas morio TaxID=2755281 RepID=A0AA38HKX1_9CUCU|nr:hypothetical protein Zmor_002924 [Zophobas morio]
MASRDSGEFRQRAPKASVTAVKHTKPPSAIGAIIVRCLINCLNEAETIKNPERRGGTRARESRAASAKRNETDAGTLRDVRHVRFPEQNLSISTGMKHHGDAVRKRTSNNNLVHYVKN